MTQTDVKIEDKGGIDEMVTRGRRDVIHIDNKTTRTQLTVH